MSNLVELKNGDVLSTTLKFAEEFDITHRHVLEKIKKITAEYPTVKKQFKSDVFKNDRNREYPFYWIDRDGYMTLVMNMGAKGESVSLLFQKKQMFIKAFNKLEELLLKEYNNKHNLEWLKSREQGKAVRLKLTDTIKDFVDYASKQGSKNSKMYYIAISKMEYSALGIIQKSKPEIRNTLDLMQLYQLAIAEDIAKKSIDMYMSQDLHYKEIYLLVKQDILNFAKTLQLDTKKLGV